MLVLVWIARYLGPLRFGLLSYGQAVIVIFTAFAVMGLADIGVRDLVREPEREEEIVASALLMRASGGFAAMLLAIAGTAVVRPGDVRALTVVAVLSASLLPQALDVIDYRFQAHMVVRPVVLMRNGSFLLFSAIRCFAILMKAPLIVFAALISFELMLVALLLFFYARWHGLSIHPRRASRREFRRLWHECWALLLRTLAIAAFMRIDQVIIAALLGDSSVGVYAAAIRLPELWYFLPTAVMTSTIPFLARSYSRSIQDYERDILRVMRPLVWLSFVVAAGLSLFSGPIVGMLYGSQYLASGPVLAVYAWAGVFGTLGLTTSSWLINAGLMRYGLYQALVGLAVNVAFNLLLVPRIGIVGSAWSYLLAQLISNFLINLALPATRPIFRGQLRTFGISI